MTKKIHVTRAQKLAAQSLVARSKKSGSTARSAVSQIAKATPRATATETPAPSSRSS